MLIVVGLRGIILVAAHMAGDAEACASALQA
jgi:hypothetical protein